MMNKTARTTLKRPVMRYHGGKWRLAPWIISHFPEHRIYVEPYGGAGSVLLRKPPAFSEVYNDLDGDVVNVFRVLRNTDQSAELERLLRLTPWSRAEFVDSYQPFSDHNPVERARRTIVRAFMSYGTTSRRDKGGTGFRGKAYRESQTGVMDWMNYPNHIQRYVERLRGVVIEELPADRVIATNDGPDTLYYVDPPYVLTTRTATNDGTRSCYRHEMTDAEHAELADQLKSLKGMVALSGYPSDLYSELYRGAGWTMVTRECLADRGAWRTEALWLNPASMNRLNMNMESQEVA